MGLKIMKALIMFALFAAWFFAGAYMERVKNQPKPTKVMCDSSHVLEGRGWIVDLTQPLFDQQCATHESFPGKILCQRMVTVECKLP